jgi:NAD(P)H-dependent FMN reductase
MGSSLNLKIIVGSVRIGRFADTVVPWVAERAEQHGAFTVDILDPLTYKLPMFQEELTGFGTASGPVWSSPVLANWNRIIKEGDAFLFITPEYNHSIPAVLKNALDSVFGTFAFRNKVAGFIGYSLGIVGGARAIEHLTTIAVEAELVPLRNAVLIAQVGQAFANGKPINAATEGALRILLDDVAWWGNLLRRARLDGELPPAIARGAPV